MENNITEDKTYFSENISEEKRTLILMKLWKNY